jgi:hypothetical protein
MANAREIDENSIDADFNIMYSQKTIINYYKQALKLSDAFSVSDC